MQPHPLNPGFVWADRKGPFRRLSPEQVRRYDEQGFVVVEDVFDRATLDELIAAIDPIEEELTAMVREKLGGKAFIMRSDEITFAAHLVAKSEVARRFTHDPFFLDVTHDLLGPDVQLYWDQSVYKKPGTEAPFPWHQDNGYAFVLPQQYLTCWVALTDATLDNGCPWVIPGAHREGTYAHELEDLGWVCTRDPEEKMPAPVAAGGVVLFSSLTPHATGPNSTDDVRKAYIVQYSPMGAEVVTLDGDREIRTPANSPEFQYSVLAGGEPAN